MVATNNMPLRILVVDDHPDTTRCVARLLERSGHAVRTAGGFHAAVAAAGAGRFDVLLCDIGLPDGDGCDLLARVSALYPVTAVAVTGYGTPADLRRYEQAGFDECLVKPLEFGRLAATVERVAAAAAGRRLLATAAGGER